MKRLFEFLLVLILFICLFINKHSFSLDNNNNRKITVYIIKENTKYEYNLKIGDTVKDLILKTNFQNLDRYSLDYDLNFYLYDEQTIILKEKSSLISINTADQNELISIPGIGVKTAEKIITYRNIHNGFKYIEEIKNISGIGDKKYEIIKDYITL